MAKNRKIVREDQATALRKLQKALGLSDLDEVPMGGAKAMLEKFEAAVAALPEWHAETVMSWRTQLEVQGDEKQHPAPKASRGYIRWHRLRDEGVIEVMATEEQRKKLSAALDLLNRYVKVPHVDAANQAAVNQVYEAAIEAFNKMMAHNSCGGTGCLAADCINCNPCPHGRLGICWECSKEIEKRERKL